MSIVCFFWVLLILCPAIYFSGVILPIVFGLIVLFCAFAPKVIGAGTNRLFIFSQLISARSVLAAGCALCVFCALMSWENKNDLLVPAPITLGTKAQNNTISPNTIGRMTPEKYIAGHNINKNQNVNRRIDPRKRIPNTQRFFLYSHKKRGSF